MLLLVPELVLLRFWGVSLLAQPWNTNFPPPFQARRSYGTKVKVERISSVYNGKLVVHLLYASIFGNSECILNLVNKESYIVANSYNSSHLVLCRKGHDDIDRSVRNSYQSFAHLLKGSPTTAQRSTRTALSSANRPCTHPAPAQLPMTWSVFSTTSLPPAFPSSLSLPLAWS